MASLPPYQLAGLFYIGAAIAVAPSVFRGEPLRLPWTLPRANSIRLMVALLCGGVAGPLFLLFGLRLASAASVSMWLTLEAVFTTLLAFFLFKEHLGRWGWLGVAGATVAAAMLSLGEGAMGIQAGLLVSMACLCWALDNNLTAVVDGISPSQITLWKGIVAGIINMTIGLLLQPQSMQLPNMLAALVVGACCYGLSITLYIVAAQGLGAARSQIIFASSPFWGVLLAAFCLHEPISAVQIYAGAIFIAALSVLFRDKHSHLHVHEPTSHLHMHSHDDGHHNHNHEGLPASTRHSHWHEHERMEHSHPHWPDLHHRHDHK